MEKMEQEAKTEVFIEEYVKKKRGQTMQKKG